MSGRSRSLVAGVGLVLAAGLLQPLLPHGAAEPVTPVQAAPKAAKPKAAKPRASGPTLASLGRQRRQLTAGELAQLLALVGFRGSAHRTAWLVAMRESHGRPRSHNDNASTGDNSYGLFQINMRGPLGTARRLKYALDWNGDLFNPVTNARVAYAMSSHGRDFGAWGLGPNAYRQRGYSSLRQFQSAYPGEPRHWGHQKRSTE